MEVFYDPSANLNLAEFGVQIPLTDRRVEHVVKFLESKSITYHNHVGCEINISEELIRLVHDDSHCNKLFGNENAKEKVLAETFELYDDRGQANRYKKELARYPLHHLADRVMRQANGTLVAAVKALSSGRSFFLGGGFHHAMSFGGRGFCLLNDIVIASQYLRQNHQIAKIWVIDLDVHKGDGTAELAHKDRDLVTLSIHMASAWPLDSDEFDKNGKQNPWFIPSDIDIPIAENEEDQYLAKLKVGLEKLKSHGKPDFVFVVQGSDPYEKDQLESASLIKLTLEQMLARDLMVYQELEDLAVPHCHVMSGGYGVHAHEPFVEFFRALHGKSIWA